MVAPFKRPLTILFSVGLVVVRLPVASAERIDLGTIGQSYEIAEPDALAEIENQAAAVNWQAVIAKKKEEAAKNYRPKDGVSQLGRVEADAVFMVDMTYTVEMDVPDGRGGILYPKGYTFNPLDYMVYPNTIVVIDGEDEEQVNWFLASRYTDIPKIKLLITRGPWDELSEKLKRPVYYLTEPIARRLQITKVPSVAAQNGKMMEVRQIYVPPKTD